MRRHFGDDYVLYLKDILLLFYLSPSSKVDAMALRSSTSSTPPPATHWRLIMRLFKYHWTIGQMVTVKRQSDGLLGTSVLNVERGTHIAMHATLIPISILDIYWRGAFASSSTLRTLLPHRPNVQLTSYLIIYRIVDLAHCCLSHHHQLTRRSIALTIYLLEGGDLIPQVNPNTVWHS